MLQRLLKLLGIIALAQSKNSLNPNQDQTTQLISPDVLGDSGSVVIDYDQFLRLKKEADETAFKVGDFLQAINLANQAIAFNPNGEWINYDKGLYQSNLGMNEEAIESFTKEINLAYSPLSLARSHFERGVCYLRQRKFKQGFADFELAEENDHEKELQKVISENREDYKDQFEQEKDINNRHGDLIELLRQKTDKDDKIAKMLEVLDQEIEEELVFPKALFRNKQKHLTKIHQQFTQTSELDYPLHPEIVRISEHLHKEYKSYLEGIDNFKAKRYEQAIMCFDDQLNSGFGNYQSYNLRGLSKLSLNQSVAAIVDFSLAIEGEENIERSHNFTDHRLTKWLRHNRGVAYTKLGLLEEALADFNEEIGYNSNSESLFYRGIIHKSLGHEKEAQEDFKAASNIGLLTIFSAIVTIAVIGMVMRIGVGAGTEDDSPPIHRSDENEIRGALKTLAKAIFEYIDLDEEQKKSLLQIDTKRFEEICDDLTPAKNTEEVQKILSDKYGEELSQKVVEIFENIYSQSSQFKTTRSQGGYPTNFVYNAAIKSDIPVISINQKMLKKYIQIFDEIIKEEALALKSKAEKGEVVESQTFQETSKTPETKAQTSKDSVSKLVDLQVDQELTHM